MPERFAVYFAPETETPLWQRASAWLGRDAATGAMLPQPVPPGLNATRFAEITADPCHYGFHATLKAPFALAEHTSRADLFAALAALAADHPAFVAAITPQELGNFVAFRLAAPSDAMQALHEACVRRLDPFRAVPTATDLARRRRAPLTALQDEQLVTWGYPYIFSDFRFHMTLTGRIEDATERLQLLAAANQYFAADSGAHAVTSLSLFHQPDATSPFTILARFKLPPP